MVIKIDADVTIEDLIKSWVNGNISHVISALASDHAGLTAVLLMQGLQDGRLTRSDANSIANRLMDRRISECAE